MRRVYMQIVSDQTGLPALIMTSATSQYASSLQETEAKPLAIVNPSGDIIDPRLAYVFVPSRITNMDFVVANAFKLVHTDSKYMNGGSFPTINGVTYTPCGFQVPANMNDFRTVLQAWFSDSGPFGEPIVSAFLAIYTKLKAIAVSYQTKLDAEDADVEEANSESYYDSFITTLIEEFGRVNKLKAE